MVNHNLIHVHKESKRAAKKFPVTVSYQKFLFLAEELLREGKFFKKGELYQVSLSSTGKLHRTSKQGLINAVHPTFYLRIQKDKRLVFIFSQ